VEMLSANEASNPATNSAAKYEKLLAILGAFEVELHCFLW
jgi:hypothetical protein